MIVNALSVPCHELSLAGPMLAFFVTPPSGEGGGAIENKKKGLWKLEFFGLWELIFFGLWELIFFGLWAGPRRPKERGTQIAQGPKGPNTKPT